MASTPYVTGRPGALVEAMATANLSYRDMDAKCDNVSRATIQRIATERGYGIAKDKAEQIAAAVDKPIGTLFVHKDGAPLGVG